MSNSRVRLQETAGVRAWSIGACHLGGSAAGRPRRPARRTARIRGVGRRLERGGAGQGRQGRGAQNRQQRRGRGVADPRQGVRRQKDERQRLGGRAAPVCAARLPEHRGGVRRHPRHDFLPHCTVGA